MNKQKVLIIFLIILLLVALSYISWQNWIKIRNSIFLSGYSSAIQALITTAENEKCETFPVFLDEKTVNLINVKCLKVLGGEGN
ncbi:MAG: hypothetical protein AAB565_01045 [Patescibacteria group bacterium]